MYCKRFCATSAAIEEKEEDDVDGKTDTTHASGIALKEMVISDATQPLATSIYKLSVIRATIYCTFPTISLPLVDFTLPDTTHICC